MPVVIKRNFGRLVDTTLWTREDWRAVGDLAVERIRRRTLSGQDADGRAFAGYSDGYAKRKSEALGTTRVDLQVSGAMLNNMKVLDTTDTSVTIGWLR